MVYPQASTPCTHSHTIRQRTLPSSNVGAVTTTECHACTRDERSFATIRRLLSRRYQVRYTGPDGVRHNAPSTFGARIDAEAFIVAKRREIDRGVWDALLRSSATRSRSAYMRLRGSRAARSLAGRSNSAPASTSVLDDQDRRPHRRPQLTGVFGTSHMGAGNDVLVAWHRREDLSDEPQKWTGSNPPKL